MYRYTRDLLLLLLLACSAVTYGQSQTNVIDEVAWIVGDEPILRSDIERQRLYYESMGQHFPGNARCIIPEQMAVQKLFLNQAQIDSVYPNEQMVNQEVNHWLESVTSELGGRDKVEEYLGQRYSQIREDRLKVVREEFTVMQMQRQLVGEIVIAPSEVTRFYEEVDKDSLPFIPQTVEVQILSLKPKMSMTEVDRVKARLVDFTKQINSGERSFETLARLYSEDKATAMKGGELGYLGRAELEPEFANVAFGLRDPGKVSRVVQTKRGYHIMQLIDRRDDLINVRHIMLRPNVDMSELDKATTRLDSIAHLVRVDSLDFGTAAMYFSADEDTRLSNGQMVNGNTQSNQYGTSRFQLEDLPQEVSAVVAKLEVNELSQPFRMHDKDNNEIIAIVRLKDRHDGHRANVVDDYQVVKSIVEARKRSELIDEWIREKQKTTYVRISPAYRDCDFQYPGWVLDN